ncbi:MAG: DUF6768 family protein [Parvularcula sp.]
MTHPQNTVPHEHTTAPRPFHQGHGLFAALRNTLRGPYRHWARFAIGLLFVMTGVGVWTVWEMLHAGTTRGLILWAFAAWAAWTYLVALKMWLLSRLNTDSILTELHSLEQRLDHP